MAAAPLEKQRDASASRPRYDSTCSFYLTRFFFFSIVIYFMQLMINFATLSKTGATRIKVFLPFNKIP